MNDSTAAPKSKPEVTGLAPDPAPKDSQPKTLPRTKTFARVLAQFLAILWHSIFSKPSRALWLLLVVTVLLIVATAVCLRVFVPESAITVDAFEIQDDQAKLIGVTGKALANRFADYLQHVIVLGKEFKGGQFSSNDAYGRIPDPPHIPIHTSFGLEVKGFSIAQVEGLWDNLRYSERFIVSGELAGQGSAGHLELRVRYASDNASEYVIQGLKVSQLSDADDAMGQLAPSLISKINPEAGARYHADLGALCQDSQCRETNASNLQTASNEWVKKEPNQAKGFFFLGYAHYLMEQYVDANTAFDKALNLNPHLGIALNSKGVVLMRLNRFDEAEQVFMNLNTSNSFMNLGTMKMLQGRCSEAIHYYKSALAIDSENAGTFTNLGNAFRCTGNSAEAISQYQTALRLKPTIIPALMGLGFAYADAGKPEEGFKQCSLAAGLESESFYRKWCEAYVWLERKDGTTVNNATEAIEMLESVITSAIKANPKAQPVDALLDESDGFLLKGDAATAQKKVEFVISYITSNAPGKAMPLARAHLYLGRVYSKLGDKVQRDSEYKVAQQLDPHIKYQNLLDWQPPWSRDDLN